MLGTSIWLAIKLVWAVSICYTFTANGVKKAKSYVTVEFFSNISKQQHTKLPITYFFQLKSQLLNKSLEDSINSST